MASRTNRSKRLLRPRAGVAWRTFSPPTTLGSSSRAWGTLAMICPNCGHDNVPGEEACERCSQDLTHLDQPSAHDRFEHMLQRDDVQSLKPTQPVVVRADAPVRVALALMAERK